MGAYSIKDLEKLSGIKAHTIRIWEQRYKILSPERTDTNIRLYNDKELKKLLNIKSLLDSGMKISKISALPQAKMNEKLDEKLAISFPGEEYYGLFVNKLIASGLGFEEASFEKTFSNAVIKHGFYKTIKFIVYPLLNRVGLMWGKDEINPAQEHFISNLIRQKLFTAIDGISVNAGSSKKFTLFLPENEDHEIGLLFANYILRNAGYQTIYLGQRVPLENLIETIHVCNPTHLFTILTVHQSAQLFYFQKLADSLRKGTKVYASGNSELFSTIEGIDKIKWIDSLESFEKELL